MPKQELLMILALVLCKPLAAADSGYAHPDLLAEAAALTDSKARDSFIVLDAREKKKYDEGHIPGARWVDHAGWSSAFGDGKDAKGWSGRIAALGIRLDSKVIIYDDNAAREAARIWWILRYWGIENARLLNGGWKSWVKSGLPLTKEAPAAAASVEISLKPRSERLATKSLILDSLKGGALQVIDARSEGEFCGTEKHAKRGGAIPGARHLEWSELLDKETQRFKGADDLRRLFKEAEVDLEKPAAAHCQSGGRASVMVFGMELLGAKDVRNYYASWSEWGNAEDTPIIPGKPRN